MPRVIARVWFGVWLGCFAAAAAQLPPDVLVDQYLLRADRLMESEDPKGALEMLGKIVALQKEHGLTLPDEFHFKHAKVAFSAGSIEAARESVNRYLTVAGRESNFYREALELSLEIGELGAERTPCAGQTKGSACWMELVNQPNSYVWNSPYQPYKTVTWTGEYLGNLAHGKGKLKWVWNIDQAPRDVSTSRADEPKCMGQPEGSACWMEVTGQPGCYVWDNVAVPDATVSWTVTWTGTCCEGRAQGEGTLKWVWVESKHEDLGTSYYERTSESTGSLKEGKKHGKWTDRDANGRAWEGSYVEGKRQGEWVVRFSNGSVAEGPYMDGEYHGQWIIGQGDGSESKDFYLYGERVGDTSEAEEMEGLLVKGKAHGDWVVRFPDGGVAEGPYVDGERHGDWSERDADKEVRNGPYVNGKRHGNWIEHSADGEVWEGPYAEGKRHGGWVIRTTHGNKVEGAYVDGKRHGRWVWRGENGDAWQEGAYLGGKRHGQWVNRYSDTGEINYKGAYVDGKKHGDWVESDTTICLSEGAYVEGKRHGRWTCSINRKDKEELNWIANYKNGVYHGEYIWYDDPNASGDMKYHKKGSYVDGKMHGPWYGKYLGKGSYIHGKKDSHWVEKPPFDLSGSWDDASGSYLDDKRHGDWILRKQIDSENESKEYPGIKWMRWKGPFVQGEMHGGWRQEASDGTIKGVYYEEGKEQDSWFYQDAHGNTYDGPIVDGKKHGVWNEFYFQTEDHTLYIKGSYVYGKRQGRWNIYRLRDRNKKVRGGGLYVNGSKTGPWIEFKDYYGGKTKYNYGAN